MISSDVVSWPLSSEPLSSEDIRKDINEKLRYLNKEELLALYSSIIPNPPKRLILLPSLLIMEPFQKYLSYDPEEGNYQEGSDDENVIYFGSTQFLVYNPKNKTSTSITGINFTIPGRYLMKKDDKFFILKIKSNLVTKLIKIKIPSNSIKVHELAFKTFLVELDGLYQLIRRGEVIYEFDKYWDIKIIKNGFKIPNSFINWGDGKLYTILKSGEISIIRFTRQQVMNLFCIEMSILSEKFFAQFGNEGTEEGREVVNIYTFEGGDEVKQLKLLQTIYDIRVPTALNDHYWITSEGPIFSIWRTEKLGLETDYIKIAEFPYLYHKVIILPVPNDKREKVSKFLSSLIQIPLVLISFTVDFL